LSDHCHLPGVRLLQPTAAKQFWAWGGAPIEALPGRLARAPVGGRVEVPVEVPAGRPAAVSPA